jgi:hypothetical protein
MHDDSIQQVTMHSTTTKTAPMTTMSNELSVLFVCFFVCFFVIRFHGSLFLLLILLDAFCYEFVRFTVVIFIAGLTTCNILFFVGFPDGDVTVTNCLVSTLFLSISVAATNSDVGPPNPNKFNSILNDCCRY